MSVFVIFTITFNCPNRKYKKSPVIMNFSIFLFLFSLVFAARLGFNGSIHAPGKYGEMSPRSRALLARLLKIKRCKALGRFC